MDGKWKYLREATAKDFDSSRNTSLNEYLETIFPDNQFLYNYTISKDDIPEGVVRKRYKCDAICKDLNLVVEFDGIHHYMDTQVVLNDTFRDTWFRSIEYNTIRIPYWLQLSNHVIKDLFDVDINDSMCILEYCFYNPEKQKVNYNILPGNMCELGRRRFFNEFNQLSSETQEIVIHDIKTCLIQAKQEYGEWIQEYLFPEYLQSCLQIKVY